MTSNEMRFTLFVAGCFLIAASIQNNKRDAEIGSDIVRFL